MLSLLATLAVVGKCMPGVGRVAKAATVAYPLQWFGELWLNTKWIYLGLPTDAGGRYIFENLYTCTYVAEDLPERLREMAGTYLLTETEAVLVMTGIWASDVGFSLGGMDGQQFEETVPDGPLKEEIRTRFQDVVKYGIDVKRILQFGLRRQQDVLLKTILSSKAKATA